MDYKIIFKVFVFSMLLLLLAAIVSDYRISFNSTLGFIGYFYLTIYCIKKFGNKTSTWNILLLLFVIRCLLDPGVIYGYFVGEIWSLPMFLFHICGMMSGFFYLRFKRPFNLLPFFFSSLFIVFMFYQGWDYWIHKSNFGTFTGKVEAFTLPTKFEAYDEQQNLFTNKDFDGKIVLLDFWTTTCGICFKKFPQVQTVYDKYKNDSSLMILAVNSPIEEDKPNQAFSDIREEEHSFPVVITKDEDLAEKYGVKGYPTTFVINRNKQIVYKGDIEGAVKMVDELKSNE